MKRLAVSIAALVALSAFAAEPAKAPPPNPKGPPAGAPTMAGQGDLSPDELKKVLYALGVSFAKGVSGDLGLSKEEFAEVQKGINDQMAGKAPEQKPQEIQPKLQQLMQSRKKKLAEAEAKKGEATLAKAAAEKGATKLPSGVIITHSKPGTGNSPAATDTVTVHYRGTLTDGTEFDSSYKRNQTIDFPLNQVIKCWTDGVGAMKVGGKAKLVCPPDLAYGANPPPGSGIPPGAVLNFEVELIGIKGK